ncbi:MAG: TonB-dependent receptor [Bacteroidota bacterium]
MYRKLFCVLVGILVFPIMVMGADGKIRGKVVDKETNEPLVGATIIIDGTTMGTATQISGEYFILNVPAGTYALRASYVGYQTNIVSNVRVNIDLTTEINFALAPTSVQLQAVEIVAGRPLLVKDQTNTLVNKSSEEINLLPVRGVTNVAGLQASIVQNEGSNNLFVRGGRSTEVNYMIDGVSVTNPLYGTPSATFANVNQNNVEELQIQTGGFNAEYGSAMSGVVAVVTKQGGSQYHAIGEFVTDGFMKPTWGKRGGYGYYDANVVLNGPVIPGDNTANFSLSIQRIIMTDNDPRAIGGVKPNNSTHSWDFAGKFYVRPITDLELKFGGTAYIRKGNVGTFANNGQVDYYDFNSDHQQKFDNGTYTGFIRATQNVGSNFYYDVQAGYFDESVKQGDGVWFDDLLSYGLKSKNPSFVQDGVQPPYVYNVLAPPGRVLDRFTKSDSRIWTFTGNANLQTGNHLLKAGLEYRLYKIRWYTINPVDLAIPRTGADAGWDGYRNCNVQYFGYDYAGNWYNGGDDFFGSGHSEAAKKPNYFAAYIQDKVELSDLILNIGFRLDRFDAKEQVFKDPVNPFGARGTPGAGVFTPDDLRNSTPTTIISPRLGFSFPVTDKSVFHAQYGTFLQMPELWDVLASKTYADRMIVDAPYSGTIANPDLKPERTISYEIGFKQMLSDNAALSITGFYKEIKDLIQVRNVGTATDPAYPNSYQPYENVDFGNVKGFDIIFELRRTNHIAATVNYTLGFADGTGSNPDTQGRITWIQTQSPKIISALDFDRRHSGSINLDYRLGTEEGPKVGDIYPLEQFGVNLLFVFNSGVPYTPSVVYNPWFGTTSIQPIGQINSAYTPWNFRFDLRVDRAFKAGPFNLIASLTVLNLLDTKNVVAVWRATGMPNSTGWLSTLAGQQWAEGVTHESPTGVVLDPATAFSTREADPTNYGIPRQIRLGIRVEY